ncbi:MAG: DUF2339 domain-containing protein, partial [Phycisphaerales bacterium]|nr:DUF2339 domain-containing protein [Phycisphaerales bacterium]
MSRRDILALQSQIRGLSERLWHLEQTVRRLPTPTDPTPQADITPLPQPPTKPEPTTPPPVTPPTSLTEALAARKSTVRRDPTPAAPPTEPAPIAAPTTDAQRLDRINKTLSAAKNRDAINLEWLVGGRIYAILGAIVVIAGAGLFLKLAWDSGWFEIIPDAWKCILAASFGGALLVTGEYLRKKWGPIASIGCSAAGLGVIYASAYAAYAVFQLVPHQVGFAMLAATAALGVFIGARARLVSVAIVSMLGAYLTPLVFLDVEPTPLVLPTYLVALLLTGLILCARLGGRFVATRAIAWWGTVLFGTFWVFANAADHPLIACAFLALSWCAMQGELTFTCLRASASPDNLTPDAPVTRSVWARIRPFMVSFSTSAWAGFMGSVVMNWWQHEPWMAAASGFAATTALGLWLAGHMRVLRDAPESDRERLGAAFIAQAGVFLIMTVALGLAGWLEVAAWIALGAAAIAAGRWMRARPLDIYG